ncbi:shikimate dehydrogenase [Pacificimonas sp. WHA3]|uniref:Shikimate dehydrogenase (NADP(+)) n=1 Tax=Pacificimonas pallii TaxID=2827236 RepID=A0ABS6SCC8_9SPHN|nr:shikimate dehydrogenase [Pacificimonas pallii]MBV7255753.1 shikimate dehydrogenase [Pacificimonas pallii]
MTRPYAEVIGDPIAQSKSPLIHRFWLEKLGIDADYRHAHVLPAELGDYIAARRRDPLWRGCNVTAPHKQAVLAACHSITPDVNMIGAANTVANTDASGISAHNTDWQGFLRPLGQMYLGGRHAVVIGAGGAARAILYALRARGIGHVTMINRTRKKAAALLGDLQIVGDVQRPGMALPPADLLINASTLGMAGFSPLEIDIAPLPSHAAVYDIVYSPLETDLLRAARQRDLICLDGLGMLIGQAMAAFSVFFGEDAPHADEDDLRALLTS